MEPVLNIISGVIGPDRMFGPGSLYESIQWFWLLGALLPILFYVLVRLFPRSPARLLNAPVYVSTSKQELYRPQLLCPFSFFPFSCRFFFYVFVYTKTNGVIQHARRHGMASAVSFPHTLFPPVNNFQPVPLLYFPSKRTPLTYTTSFREYLGLLH